MSVCGINAVTQSNIEILEPGAEAHCKRVAAWCEELALAMHLPAREVAALREAALMHHHPLAFLQGEGFGRLIGDLGLKAGEDPALPRLVSKQAEEILIVVRGKRKGAPNSRATELALLLEMSNAFDEQLEAAPFESESLELVLQQELDSKQSGDRAVPFVLRHLRKAKRSDLPAIIHKLPVYPTVAMQLYQMLSSDDVSLPVLDKVAKSDQVIAGKMLQAANSTFYSPRQTIKSVSQAISYVGTEDARRILLASAVQPLFSTPRLRRIWRHAVEAAQVCEQIAVMSKKVEPSEAFLVGLLHDVGKLAIALMPAGLNASLERLAQKGCQSGIAEVVVCGFDHAEAGADVLRHWKFTEELVDAVRYHHTLQKASAMSAILYLTEFWTDSEEDIPSNARLDLAFEIAGITAADLSRTKFEFNEALGSM